MRLSAKGASHLTKRKVMFRDHQSVDLAEAPGGSFVEGSINDTKTKQIQGFGAVLPR
jgi:hypothetical protein